jgi:hypothetical protein
MFMFNLMALLLKLCPVCGNIYTNQVNTILECI